MNDEVFSQAPYRCRLDWSAVGAQRAAERGDIIVVVDVLSFSTVVGHAVSQGAVIYPCAENADVSSLANRFGAHVAVKRDDAPQHGRYSLSPKTFDNIPEGTKVVLPSLNGGTCSQIANAAAHIFAGALISATAVSGAVTQLMNNSSLNVSVIACGEREKEPPGDLRPAIEDYLGAGAIISRIPSDKSPEAQICEAAFLAKSAQIDSLVWESISGRELRAAGYEDDVRFASRLDAIDVVPMLDGEVFVNYRR